MCYRYIVFFFCLWALGSCSKKVLIPDIPITAERPKNVVIMIGDGMGLPQITAHTYGNKGSIFQEFKVIGLQTTHSANSFITDSAAGATAMATGKKTFNRGVGIGPDSTHLKSIIDYAMEEGYLTGIITTSSLTHATPAAFYAHQGSRAFTEMIADDLVNSKINFLVGGGKRYFDDQRSDGRSLYPALVSRGYTITDYTKINLSDVQTQGTNHFIYFSDQAEPKLARLGLDHLTLATNKAFDFFRVRDPKGYILIIEGAQIDWAGHANDPNALLIHMRGFEMTIRSAIRHAAQDGETLVIVTADHETGGLQILDGTEKDQINLEFTTKNHTATMVPVFAFGPGSERFRGVYDNTEIFTKVMESLGWQIINNFASTANGDN